MPTTIITGYDYANATNRAIAVDQSGQMQVNLEATIDTVVTNVSGNVVNTSGQVSQISGQNVESHIMSGQVISKNSGENVVISSGVVQAYISGGITIVSGQVIAKTSGEASRISGETLVINSGVVKAYFSGAIMVTSGSVSDPGASGIWVTYSGTVPSQFTGSPIVASSGTVFGSAVIAKVIIQYNWLTTVAGNIWIGGASGTAQSAASGRGFFIYSGQQFALELKVSNLNGLTAWASLSGILISMIAEAY